MTLKDDFYKITKTEACDDGFRYRVQLNARHSIFKAHFPGNPITPGVCLMQMATEIMEGRIGKSLRQHSIPRIKFSRAMTPDVEPVVTFSKIAQDGCNLSMKVNAEAEGIHYVSMSLQYTVEEERR